MRPDDPNTLYAPAYGLIGLFRSTDAGATWHYTGGISVGNYELAVDARHADWLWAYTSAGVMRSTDQGDAWAPVMGNTWPDESRSPIGHGQVYPSPSDGQVVFVSSYHEPLKDGSTDDALGLIRSSDGGARWTISVADLAGVSVVDVAFDPTNAARMALVTQDAKVYLSGDAGETWTEEAGPPVASIGFNREIAYNPFVSGEVWILSTLPDGVFKSTDAGLSGWQDVTPPASLQHRHRLHRPGLGVPHPLVLDGRRRRLEPFGPQSGSGSLRFTPGGLVGYVGNSTYGVQKTTDGGQHWAPADEGLAGMTCSSMSVSPTDPLRVFASFGNWPGVHRSLDGAGTWSSSRSSAREPRASCASTRPHPTPSTRRAGRHRPESTDGGKTWTDLGFLHPRAARRGGLRCGPGPVPARPPAGHVGHRPLPDRSRLSLLERQQRRVVAGRRHAAGQNGADHRHHLRPRGRRGRSTSRRAEPATRRRGRGSTGAPTTATAGQSRRPGQAGHAQRPTISVATHPRQTLYAAGRSRRLPLRGRRPHLR